VLLKLKKKTIDELRKIVTEDSKLTDTYRELNEVNLLKTNCDIPPYLSAMADSLNLQHEEISKLKAVLQEKDSIMILLSNITTEMDSLNEAMQAAGENQEGKDDEAITDILFGEEVAEEEYPFHVSDYDYLANVKGEYDELAVDKETDGFAEHLYDTDDYYK